MHLIMRTQFDELRLNDEYEYSTNDRGGKKVVKIYKDGELIAKKVSIKNSVQYFGVTGVEELLEQAKYLCVRQELKTVCAICLYVMRRVLIEPYH